MWLLEFVFFFLDRAASSVVPQRKIRNLKWELWVLLVRFSIRIKHRKRTYWITFAPLDWCIYSYSYTSMDLEGVLWQIEKYIHRLHHEESSKDIYIYSPRMLIHTYWILLHSVCAFVAPTIFYYSIYARIYIYITFGSFVVEIEERRKKRRQGERKMNEYLYILVGV